MLIQKNVLISEWAGCLCFYFLSEREREQPSCKQQMTQRDSVRQPRAKFNWKWRGHKCAQVRLTGGAQYCRTRRVCYMKHVAHDTNLDPA